MHARAFTRLHTYACVRVCKLSRSEPIPIITLLYTYQLCGDVKIDLHAIYSFLIVKLEKTETFRLYPHLSIEAYLSFFTYASLYSCIRYQIR